MFLVLYFAFLSYVHCKCKCSLFSSRFPNISMVSRISKAKPQNEILPHHTHSLYSSSFHDSFHRNLLLRSSCLRGESCNRQCRSPVTAMNIVIPESCSHHCDISYHPCRTIRPFVRPSVDPSTHLHLCRHTHAIHPTNQSQMQLKTGLPLSKMLMRVNVIRKRGRSKQNYCHQLSFHHERPQDQKKNESQNQKV